MTEPFIYELLIVLTFGLVAGLVSRRLGLPTLVGYLIAGALLGHGSLDWVSRETHEIEYLAEAGVFLLLFSIGLEFSLDELARMRRHLLVGGVAQMLLASVPAGLALWWMEFSPSACVLLSAAMAFSSTVLVFKALSEAGQTERADGRRAIGILLFQDAALVPLLLLTSLLVGEAPQAIDYLWLVAGSALFILVVMGLRYLLGKYVVDQLAAQGSPELLVLFALVVLGAVTLFASVLSLPPAVGAFAAGLSLGGNRLSGQVDALLLPFRETFAAVFFVSLGLLLNLSRVLEEPHLVAGGILCVLVLKTTAATLALRLTALPWRRAIGMGVGLAHVGEFAYVLLLVARHAGLVSVKSGERFIAIGVGTLIISPLLMQWGLRFGTRSPLAEDDQVEPTSSEILDAPVGRAMVVGLGPVGRAVASQLETMGYALTLIDRSAINAQALAQLGAHVLAGDATDGSLLDSARTESFELIVVCVPDDAVALQVVDRVRRRNAGAKVIVRCRYASTVPKLRRNGADIAVSEEATASLEMLTQIRGAAQN